MSNNNENLNKNNDIHCLTIIGQIEGHVMLPPQNKTTKYEHILPQLVAINQDENVKGLLVLLNTVGGDVEAGLAISEMIASLGKPVVSLVLGGGHSIGVPLATSANYSFICKTATMTIHPVRMNGTIIGVQQAYEYFEKMQERISTFVVKHSHITEERFKELLLDTGNMAKDVGTLIGGEEAVKEGIIDEIGGLNEAIKKLKELIKENEKSSDGKKKQEKIILEESNNKTKNKKTKTNTNSKKNNTKKQTNKVSKNTTKKSEEK